MALRLISEICFRVIKKGFLDVTHCQLVHQPCTQALEMRTKENAVFISSRL